MLEVSNAITHEKAVNSLAKNYNTLAYFPKLIELANLVYPSQNFSEFSKYQIHHKLNQILIDHYNGEQILKYKLFQRYSPKRNFVAAFEIKVNNSRVDFLTINGHTTSYEIKSELDNFTKFKKQATDYIQVFEFNNLLVDEIHIDKAKEIIPNKFGLWIYNKGKQKQIKKAELNNELNPEAQLKLLTKKELNLYFTEVEGNPRQILISFKDEIINKRFKKALKDRYRDRWDFVIKNHSSIFPIDLQFFFNSNIDPTYIYNY